MKKDMKIKKLEQQLAEKDKELAEMKTELEKRDMEIRGLEAQVKEFQYDNRELRKEFNHKAYNFITGQDKKIAKLKQQLAELKDKMETWQSELFDKLTDVAQTIDNYSVEIPLGDKTPSLMLIGSKEFEKDIDEIIDKFCR